jgi:hypothetical protein
MGGIFKKATVQAFGDQRKNVNLAETGFTA